MAKPEWGVKRACPSCATRFYDLMRDPITCPACGETFAMEVFARPRRGKAVTAAPVKAAPKKPKPDIEEEAEEIEGSTELADDDDVLDLEDDDAETPPVAASTDDASADDASLPEFTDDEEDGTDVLDSDDDDVLDDDDDDVSLDELGEAENAEENEDRD